PVIGRAPACHPAWRLSLARRSARLQPPVDARPDLGRAAADPGPAALGQRPDARAGLPPGDQPSRCDLGPLCRAPGRAPRACLHAPGAVSADLSTRALGASAPLGSTATR